MNAIFITARLKSTRLPKKVLLKVNGKPIIQYLIDRLKHNTINKKIILCTSTNSEDNELENIARINNIGFFRGAEDDVLLRYYECATANEINNFYIIYGDEPFVDIELMEKTFDQLNLYSKVFIDNSNLVDGTFGYGLNYETINYINANKTSENNEVWGIMVSKMDIKRIVNSYLNFPYDPKSVRLTIDYPEDLVVFEKLIESIGDNYKDLTIVEFTKLYHDLNLFLININRNKDYTERIRQQGNI